MKDVHDLASSSCRSSHNHHVDHSSIALAISVHHTRSGCVTWQAFRKLTLMRNVHDLSFSSCSSSRNRRLDYSAVSMRYPCVPVPPAVSRAVSSSKRGHKVFNARNDLSACYTREDETGTTDRSTQSPVLTWKNCKTFLYPVTARR